jgi:hypothetical protein
MLNYPTVPKRSFKGSVTCPLTLGLGVCANKSVTKWGKTAIVDIINKDSDNDSVVILFKCVL